MLKVHVFKLVYDCDGPAWQKKTKKKILPGGQEQKSRFVSSSLLLAFELGEEGAYPQSYLTLRRDRSSG